MRTWKLDEDLGVSDSFVLSVILDQIQKGKMLRKIGNEFVFQFTEDSIPFTLNECLLAYHDKTARGEWSPFSVVNS